MLKAHQQLATALGIETDPDRLSVADLSSRVDELLAEAETSERTLSRETFDAMALARRVGPDSVKLFEWVRDQTTLVPYRGVLRGATGVLMDRLGNSLDRALLLAELLRASGASVRLAHGTLSREQALGLAQRGASPTSGSTPPAGQPADDAAAIAAVAATRRVDEARLRTAVEQLSAASQAVAQDFQQRVDRQATALTTTFTAPATLAADAVAGDVEALRDHWWVQLQRDGQWLDLDPTAADATPGRREVAATEVLAPADVPENLHHSVVIRVVVERWQAGRLQESTALEHALRPLDVLGQRVVLQHSPVNWPNLDLRGDPTEVTARITSALRDQNEWLLTLTVGSSRPVAQARVTEAGRINATSGAARPAAPQAAFGGLADAFGGGEVESPAEPAGYFTAEWIEYEIRSPARAPERLRRDVFDIIGPAARTSDQVAAPNLDPQVTLRRALALAGDSEVLLLASRLSPEYLRHVVNTALLDRRGTLREVLRKVTTGTTPEVDLLRKLPSVSRELYALALARTALSPVKDQVFLDRPNVFSFHRRIQPGTAGHVVVSKSLDIVANDVAVRSAGTNAFVARVLQGVVDTAAEALTLSGGCGGCAPVANVSELQVQTERLGAPWLPIRRLDDPAWREVTLSADARRRAEADVRAGYVVLVPPRSVSGAGTVGWWRVDPKSGTTLGIMESGRGQGLVEYAEIIVQAAIPWVVLAQILGCLGPSQGANASAVKVGLCVLCGLFLAKITTLTFGLGAVLLEFINLGFCTLASVAQV